MSDIYQFKTFKTKTYTTVDLTNVLDERLSWKAKGIHLYLMSRPPEWKIRRTDLMNRSKDGRDSLAGGIKELKEKGYVYYAIKRNIKSQFDSGTFLVFERPTSLAEAKKNTPEGYILKTEGRETSAPENPPLSNNNYSNNEKTSSLSSNEDKEMEVSSETSKNFVTRSRFIDEWNKYSVFSKHKDPSKKVYQKAHKYCLWLTRGQLDRMDIDKSFIVSSKIPEDLLTKRWSEEEIFEAFKRYSLMFMDNYWPPDKKGLPRTLPDFICNFKTGCSYFLKVMAMHPKPMMEKVAPVEDKNPDITKIYKSAFKSLYIKRLVSQRDESALVSGCNAVLEIYKRIQPLAIAAGDKTYLNTPKNFATVHSAWLKKEFGTDLTTRDITHRWNKFIKHVGDTYHIDISSCS